MKRCDDTTAWAALKGHFEAHGRGLDLREAFARDAGRFAAALYALLGHPYTAKQAAWMPGGLQ